MQQRNAMINNNAHRLQTYFYPLSKYIVPLKTSYLNIFYLSLSIACTFKVTLVVFADVFEEYYIFAIIMDPFQTSFLAPCIINTPC